MYFAVTNYCYYFFYYYYYYYYHAMPMNESYNMTVLLNRW